MKPNHMNFFNRIKVLIKAHKIWTTIIVLVLAFIGYKVYASMSSGSSVPQYAITSARIGTIRQTVSGTGQVSAENQLDVTSQVSGAVKSIDVKVGQHVTKGQLLATIDPHDAYTSLQNAQIAYAKLTASPKSGDLANAQNTVAKSYSDAFNTVASTFIDLSTVMSGMKAMLYDQGGFLSESYSVRLNSTTRPMRDSAGLRYDTAAQQFAVVMTEYKGLNRNSSPTSIDNLVSDTYSLLKSVSNAVKEAQNAVNFISINQTDYYSNAAPAAVSNLSSWSNTINSDLASVLGAQNSIASNNNSLSTLVTGADDLDIQSQQLSLQQAQETYAKYFIRSPFDGIVGRLPTSVYTQAGASTVMATVIGDQKIAIISLNEVDAAKVAVGQPVAITFDAIDSLTATGTVGQVDLVGTVTQGVVTYNVKISINTSDARILPGMSVSSVITVKEKDGVMVVPTAAVKTSGNRSYVQVIASSTVSAYLRNMQTQVSVANPNRNQDQASGTRTFGSTTPSFGGQTGGQMIRIGSASLTVPSSIAPTNQTVTVGISDDTNTEITGGLEPRTWVVTRTVTGSTAAQTTAPSILNSLGGQRTSAAGATGGNVRFTTGAAVSR